MEEKKNRKIFISGPITGVEDYRNNFASAQLDIEQAQTVCRQRRYCHDCMFYDRKNIYLCLIHKVFPNRLDVVNPAKFGCEGKSWFYTMIICLWRLHKCDYVFMLRGWDKSREATIEHKFAKFLHKTILYQH